MTKKISTKDFRSILRFLRKNFPIECPVVIKRFPKKKECDTVRFNGKVYTVYIDSSLTRQELIDTIIHFYAHIMCIDSSYNHDAEWGKKYADIYSKFLEFEIN